MSVWPILRVEKAIEAVKVAGKKCDKKARES